MFLSDNNFVKNIFNIVAVLKVFVHAFYRVSNFSTSEGTVKNKTPAFFAFIFTLSLSPNVFSAAGDSIFNTATIDYDVAGLSSSADATAVFTEDRRINFVVSDSNGGAVVPVITDMTDAVMQFTVTNMGNATNDFLLTALNTSPNPFGIPADNFDPLSIQVFVESGATPGYQLAQDTSVYIDELIPTATKIVYVVADLPTIADDDVSAIALIAQVAEGGAVNIEGAPINADDNGRISPAGTFSNGGTGMLAGTSNTIVDAVATMETVFNDPAGLDLEDISTSVAQDIIGNGQHSDTGAFQVTSPVLITKSVTVIDTLGGTDPHIGATLRYQLVVSVSGNTAVDNLIITDLIPANTTYTSESIRLNGVVQTDLNDAPVDYSQANGVSPVVSIEVDLSESSSVAVAPGVTNTITFEVTIN